MYYRLIAYMSITNEAISKTLFYPIAETLNDRMWVVVLKTFYQVVKEIDETAHIQALDGWRMKQPTFPGKISYLIRKAEAVCCSESTNAFNQIIHIS